MAKTKGHETPNEALMEAEKAVLAKSSPELVKVQLLAAELVKSGMAPFKKPEDAVVAILQGREIGLPPMASLNNIYSIEGRATFGVNVFTATLLENKIIYEILEDNSPMYEYVQLDDKKQKIKGSGIVDFYREKRNETEGRSNHVVAYGTKIRFKRKVKMDDGSYEDMIIESTFTTIDAQAANLLDKPNWKRYRPAMLRTRCLTTGARLIAPDKFLGIKETTEMLDAEDIDYEIVEDGEGMASVTNVKKNIKETEEEPSEKAEESATN